MYKQASVCLIGILLLTVSLSTSSRAQASQELRVKKTGNGEVTLEWDDPNDDNIVGYELKWWTDPDSTKYSHYQVWEGIPESNKNTTTYTVRGLWDDGVWYGFRIRAVYGGDVKGHPSEIVRATPTSTPVLPPDKTKEQDSPPDKTKEQDSPPDKTKEQDSPPDRANEQDSPQDKAKEQDSPHPPPPPMNDSGSSGGCALVGVGVEGEGEEGAGFLAILFLLALIPSVRIYRSRVGGSQAAPCCRGNYLYPSPRGEYVRKGLRSPLSIKSPYIPLF